LFERLDYLKSNQQLDSLVSRESSFLFNNLLLLAACFAVLWGTLFPVITEAVKGVKISVGAPFFNKVNIPIGLLLLFLTGVGPLFAWRKTSVASLKKNFLYPGFVSLAAGAMLYAIGVREFYPLVCFIMSIFVALTIVLEFYRGARVIAEKTGASLISAASTLTFRNTRRYGGYIVHFGIVLIFIGIAGTAFNSEREQGMKVGDKLELGPYSFRLANLEETDNDNYQAELAAVEMYRGDKLVDVMHPEKRFYKSSRQPSTEAAIRPRVSEDIYVVFAGMDEDNHLAVINVHRNPLVNWIWVGGFILIVGTLVALVPARPGLGSSRRNRKHGGKAASRAADRSGQETEHDEVPA
jgi:cytochrome c-type biogenesis protein CcmF